MESMTTNIQEAVEAVQARIKLRPRLAVVLGSGLGAFARELTDSVVVPYTDIPHFPHSTVTGHAGRLIVGRFAKAPLAVMAGRVHAYEGYSAQEVAFPVRVLGSLGIKTLLVTNASGAVNTAFRPGELMVINDHLNLTGKNPLVGPEERPWGPASRT